MPLPLRLLRITKKHFPRSHRYDRKEYLFGGYYTTIIIIDPSVECNVHHCTDTDIYNLQGEKLELPPQTPVNHITGRIFLVFSLNSVWCAKYKDQGNSVLI